MWIRPMARLYLPWRAQNALPRKVRGLLFALVALMLKGCIGCPPPEEFRTEPAPVPLDFFLLQDEAIAIHARGPAGAVANSEINLDSLRAKVPTLDEVTLLHYDAGGVNVLPFTIRERNIVADLTAGKTYVVVAKPFGRIYDVYFVLCKIHRFRDQIRPDLIDPICRFILCTPDLRMGSDLFTQFPDLQSLRTQFDIDNRQIGGWGPTPPSGICEKCTQFKNPPLIIPVDVCLAPVIPSGVKLINMVPNSLSGETNQDSEPFLAVDVTNSSRLVGTAFTPNPFGTSSGTAPVYVSTTGGDTWSLNMIVPSSGQLGTGDITVATSQVALRLYSGILRLPGNLLLNILRTNDFTSPTTMTALTSRQQVDQPFVQATTVAGNDRVYIGNNDFNVTNDRTATIDLSLNGGTTFTQVRIETRNTGGQDGPSIRPTIAKDGTVYAAYFGWRSFVNNVATSDVVVVRDDNGGTGPTPFRDLNDPSDNLAGRFVVRSASIPFSNAPTLGFERIGSTLSIAVDPNSSDIVYISWADRVGNGDIYTIHLRRSTDNGVTWSNDLRTVTNATCCAVAIADNGTAGFLYQQFTGSGASSRWVTHLEQSKDGFATKSDIVLATVPGNAPPRQFLPYIGDYNFLLSVGGEFRGIFSANNIPDMANFPNGVKYQRSADFNTKTLLDGSGNTVPISIDPFYFSVPAIH